MTKKFYLKSSRLHEESLKSADETLLKSKKNQLRDIDNENLLQQLGTDNDNLKTTPSSSESKYKALKDIKKAREKIHKEVFNFWGSLGVDEEDQELFNKKIEAAEALISAGEALLLEGVEKLLDLENEKLLEEPGASVDDFEPTPKDVMSWDKALKVVKKSRQSSHKKQVQRVK